MKINGNAIRQGNVIDHNGKLWIAVKISHVKPGKGGAFAQVELKNIRDNTKLNERFRSSETVERVILSEKEASYLYNENETFIFMDTVTFEQYYIAKSLINDTFSFLKEGMIVTISLYEDEAISIKLPETLTVIVAEADAVIKGQTVSSSFKPAILENGIRIMVPAHIERGTKIVIKTETLTYLERAKG